MISPIDVVIRVEATERAGAPKWRVEVQSVVPRARELVDPLRDEDVGGLPHVPDDVTTWRDLLASFSPGGQWTPPLPTMKAAGKLVRGRLFEHASIERHFAAVEARAREEARPLRVLFELEPVDDDTPGALSTLPLELAHDDRGFVFKQPGYGALRCDPRADARNLVLPRKGRVLLATAHTDGRAPTREALAAHRVAVVAAVEAMGWSAAELPDAAPDSLEEVLLGGSERADLLYVACHGMDDPSYGGRLALRGGQVSGETLGQWLEELARQGRPVGAVLLCACSSASPERGENTSGTAQWLAQEGRANAALGFRGPVRVEWALGFLERMFQRIAEGEAVEKAFLKARAAVRNEEPQWALPLLYVRRSDPGQARLSYETTRGSATSPMAETFSDEPSPATGSAELARPEELLKQLSGLGGGAHALAARTIEHDDLSVEDYLESLVPYGSTADPYIAPSARVRALVSRALAGLGEGDRHLFFALAALPVERGSPRELAALLHEPEPRTSTKLFRLARRGLLTLRLGGSYALDAAVREAVRELSVAGVTL